MGVHAARNDWPRIGLAKLVGGVLVPPLAWLLDLQVSYATVKWACAADARWVLLTVPLGSVALVGLASWWSWSSWTSLRQGAALEGKRMDDRNHFLSLAGLSMSAVFLLLILTSYAPRYFLSPCE